MFKGCPIYVIRTWCLANDFTGYEYSNASFYENGVRKYNVVHPNEALSEILPGSPNTQSLARKALPGR
jgi:hypothetical protein